MTMKLGLLTPSMMVSFTLPLDMVSLVLNTTLPSLVKNLTVIKILIIEVKNQGEGKESGGSKHDCSYVK